MKARIATAVKIWNMVKGISTEEIDARIALPITVAVIGSAAATGALVARLGRERVDAPAQEDVTRHVTVASTRTDAASDAIVFDAERLSFSEAALDEHIIAILARHPEARIGLARRFPAVRVHATQAIANEYAMRNAKIAGLSALPGIFPAGDWLLPLTSAGDMVALTRNQVELFLTVAACYGLPPDLQARTREFALVVGGAFLWRAAARQALGFVPAGIGVVVKAAVAYGGTYAIGRAAIAYFGSGGHLSGTAELRRYLKEGLTQFWTASRGKES